MDSFFSFVESVVTGMIHPGVLHESFNQSFNRWLRLDTFMQVLIKKINNDSCFIVPIAAFVKHRVTSAVEEELSRKPPETKHILSPLDRFPLASASATFNDEFMTKYSHRRRYDRKDRRHRNRFVKLRYSARSINVHHHCPPRRTVVWRYWPLSHLVQAHALALRAVTQTGTSVLLVMKRRN